MLLLLEMRRPEVFIPFNPGATVNTLLTRGYCANAKSCSVLLQNEGVGNEVRPYRNMVTICF